MNKRVLLFAFLSISVLLITLVLADPINIDQSKTQLENTKQTIDEIRYNYLADQWKELLLRNSFIAELDSILTKVNTFFVIVFARNYSFSLEMLFAFLIWIFTFLSLSKYGSLWLQNEWSREVAALVATILLAHLAIFNIVAGSMVKLVFYKTSAIWSISASLIVFVLIFAYFSVNRVIAGLFRSSQEKHNQEETKRRIENQEAFTKGLKEGAS